MQNISMVIRGVVMVTGIVLVSGCGASFKNAPVQPRVTTALVVQVNQNLEIPNRKARVYIQNGIKATLREVDKWSTYCSVRMKDPHAEGEPKLSVMPGRFEIIRVRESNDASHFPATFVSARGHFADFTRDVIFEVEMRLASAHQPDVWAMYCARKMTVLSPYYRSSYYPKLADISVALGNTVEIRDSKTQDLTP